MAAKLSDSDKARIINHYLNRDAKSCVEDEPLIRGTEEEVQAYLDDLRVTCLEMFT